MATELAKAYVQIIPSAEGIKGGIQQAIDPEAEPAGKSFGGKMVGMIKRVVAGAAIGKALSATISEGADLEQSLGGIETLFKESADKVKANATQAYRTAGMSANEYMELTTSFSASLLSSLGNDTSKAADIADMAMTDMSDNMNKMGTDMENIKNAYQGFAKQNYTMLDNLKLGYGGTKTEMQRLLSDAQKITGVKYDISNLSDVYSAIHVIQGELDITGTTSKEASTTLSGSFSSMKSAFKNVMGEIALGMDVGPAIKALADTSITYLGNLLPAVWNVLSALPGALVTFIQAAIPQMVTALSQFIPQAVNGIQTGLPQLYAISGEMINQIKTAIKTQLPTILENGVEVITNFVNGILSNLPSLITGAGELLANFLDAILTALPTIFESGAQMLLNLVNGIISNLPKIISAAAQMIARLVTTIAQHLPQILQSGIEIIGKLASGLIRAIPTLVGKIPQIITSVKNTFLNVDWGSIGSNIISGIANGLKNAGSMLWDSVKGILGSFKDNVLSFFGIKSPSRWGMYVGEMIDKGLANGITGNSSMVSAATDELKQMTTNPFSAVDMLYSVNDGRGQYNDDAIRRLDTLIDILKVIAGSGQELHVSIGDREFIRILRDMGVVFE